MPAGILLVGHGSQRNPHSSHSIYEHARALRERGRCGEVGVGFLKEAPDVACALEGLRADPVTVIPLFMSDGYYTRSVIPRALGLLGRCTDRGGRRIWYARPIGAHPAVAEVAAERAVEAGAGPSSAVVLLGHGTTRNPQSARTTYEHAERLAARGDFAAVEAAFIEQTPTVEDAWGRLRADLVVVVPLFMGEGWHVTETIPQDLRLVNGERREGRRLLRYARVVGTHPSLAGVIEEICADAAT